MFYKSFVEWHKRFFTKRILLSMKLTVILLVASVFQTIAVAKAQKISVVATRQPLKTVMKSIQKQEGYSFFFTGTNTANIPVSVKLKNANLEEAMQAILKDKNLTWSVKDNTIVIAEANRNIRTAESEVGVQNAVSGRIIDENGRPVRGVTVHARATDVRTQTDENGRFSFTNVPLESDLSITSLGYEAQLFTWNGQKDITITLAASKIDIAEIVVGYGTQKRSNVTGAIGTVDVEKSLKSRAVTNVQELLAGTVAGLNVSKGSGAVGSGASLNIRGTSTIGGSSGVLVLIDGVPGNINTLNPNDIESISTLKDAASASIYGSRAANGVILVTTKSGQVIDKLTVEVNSSVGVQSPQFMIDFVGAEDFMKLWDRALLNDGKEALYGEAGLQALKDGKYADVKWYEEIYKKNTLINNNYLALSGNSEKVRYRFSASHDYQGGTLPNNNYNRVIFKPDMLFKIADNFDARANIQYTETYINAPQGGTEIWQTQATRVAPTSFIRNTLGQYGMGSSIAGNPIAGVYESGFNKQKYKELMAIFELSYRPIEGMEIKGNFSRYTYDNWSKNRVSTYQLYDEQGNVASVENRVTSLTEGVDNSYRNMFQLTADYAKSFGLHNFKLLGGFSQEYFKTTDFSAFRDNLPFDDIHVLNSGGQTNMQASGKGSEVAIQSLFSRFNYDYEGKYLFQANVRADGSSRFAPGHRWGVFPSFSAGWNIHQEDFFSTDWLSSLKLRGSWGILGDAEKVGYYATAAVLSYNSAMYGFNGAVVPGAWNNVAINPRISWERSEQSNFGLDMGLLNKLNLTVDYFINKRSQILYAPPVPAEFGLGGPYNNLLRMKSYGLEAMVSYADRKGDWRWGVDMNTSFARNKVEDLAGTGPWIQDNTYTAEGGRYNLAYGYEAMGLFQTEEEIKNAASQGANIVPGNIRYKDQNEDGVINGADRVILRDKPSIRVGMNINLGWKNLDASANFYGLLQNARYISGYEGWAFFLTQNARPMHIDNWTPENPNATYPRLSLQNTSNDTQYSSYWLRSANYFKIQNVQVGYTFPQELVEKYKLSGLRLFLSAQNLATLTNYEGFDPEGGYYPLARTFSFGVNLKF
ncbi:SusC/RagA family TonB-linked outer membrane protein [Sphingobacterium sp. UT-1RO-CII-1]|uniref:SusC/RagA family TonB-linked outer membrane protein n=1 Tax=Sphingobacterium sp. UT-1RO-CII-1 TaxID=2995225 RepID=UPI00227A58C8|nr:SusC/RagA family TonB-linked outer membrane protein [Sphingobacterium sp. UT-1RO-CII-1]MCY4779240.1 SusC/RagA family TonB-linked outer membrane protein [Sphingobacterium sp. UT-1RO-CII-1]